MSPYIIWILFTILFFIFEGIVPGLISIWFGFGAMGALIYSNFDTSVLNQFYVFIGITAILLLFLRRIAKKLLNKSSNDLHRIIGQTTDVLGIDQNKNYKIYLDGKHWLGKSNEKLIVGDRVLIKGIEGIKLILKKI